MANTLNQTVSQYNIEDIEVRMIVQYVNDLGEKQQKIVSYSELTADQKNTFDAYKTLSETLMNA